MAKPGPKPMPEEERRRRRVESSRQYVLRNREKWRKWQREGAARRWREDPDKQRRKSRERHYRRIYGLRPGDKEALLAAQGGGCAICKRQDPGNPRGWCTDHNPRKKKGDFGFVRGILCHACNLTMRLDTTPALLRQIADYLEKHG